MRHSTKILGVELDGKWNRVIQYVCVIEMCAVILIPQSRLESSRSSSFLSAMSFSCHSSAAEPGYRNVRDKTYKITQAEVDADFCEYYSRTLDDRLLLRVTSLLCLLD